MPSRDDEPLEYWVDAATFGFEDDLERLLERRGMSRAELAREHGSSTAFISKVLNGSSNYTLKTMARLGRAVGGVLQVRLVHEDDEVVRVLSLEEAKLLDSLREEGRAGPKRAGGADAPEPTPVAMLAKD